MPPNVYAPLVELRGLWVGLLAVAVLGALLYSLNRMPQDSWPRRHRKTHPALCAWCLHRDGDLCTNTESPVNKAAATGYHRAECGQVCGVEVKCLARKQVPQ